MNSISINEEKYVKASDIARELGYTADYVGQLCRAKKVDAQLVGRSWYVSKESITSHKTSRYRSTKKASSDTVTKTLSAKDLDSEESFSVPVAVQKKNTSGVYAQQQFYTRAKESKKPSDYFADDSDLIPLSNTVKQKTGKLSVSLGDSQAVQIKSRSSEFDFTPSELPEVKFSGLLSISEVYDEEEVEPDEKSAEVKVEEKPTVEQARVAQEVTKTKTDGITNKIRVKHLRKDKKRVTKKLPIEHNIDGVLGMRRSRITDRNPVGGTLKVAVPTENSSVSIHRTLVIASAVVSSALVSAIIMGFQADVQAEGVVLVTSYTFEFGRLLAAVVAAW